MNIVITGCIGAGKSTIGEALAQHMGARFIEEPFVTNRFLADAYDSPECFGLRSQISFMIGFAEAQLSWGRSGRDVVQERCISDCLYIFANSLHRKGYIDSRDHELLRTLHDALSGLLPAKPDAFVLIEAPVDVIVRRIRCRGRAYEVGIDAPFIQLQADLYREWLNNVDVPVVQLENDCEDLCSLTSAILKTADQLNAVRAPSQSAGQGE